MGGVITSFYYFLKYFSTLLKKLLHYFFNTVKILFIIHLSHNNCPLIIRPLFKKYISKYFSFQLKHLTFLFTLIFGSNFKHFVVCFFTLTIHTQFKKIFFYCFSFQSSITFGLENIISILYVFFKTFVYRFLSLILCLKVKVYWEVKIYLYAILDSGPITLFLLYVSLLLIKKILKFLKLILILIKINVVLFCFLFLLIDRKEKKRHEKIIRKKHYFYMFHCF